MKKSNSYEVFHKLAILGSYQYSLAKALETLNMKSVYIYGFGEIGQMLYRQIKGGVNILGIIDVKKAQTEAEYEGVPIFLPEQIPNDDSIIIITPAAYVVDIAWSLMQSGIEHKRLWSFNMLLDVVLKYGIDEKLECDYTKQFLVEGASFENKGAQAMLFTAISEIRRRYPKALIWYMPNESLASYNESLRNKYNMLYVPCDFSTGSNFFEILHNLTAIVDVSGYALAPHFKNNKIIPMTRAAWDYNIPLYFMPQSFGPLDFEEEVNEEYKTLLPTAKAIFARERQGYEEMREKYHLENIQLSKDLVLQNKSLDLESIYTGVPDFSKYHISEQNAVAIIPNAKTYIFGNKQEILKMYKEVIDYLIQLGKKVYIVCHSNDQEVSDDIYTMYKEKESVILYDKEIDCIGYSALVQNFQYVIASRYHAIVHAYKENIPCIAIGWAEKYKELLNSFQQEQYIFDVREGIDVSTLKEAIVQMDANYQKEKLIIADILPEMQKRNCFDVLSEL